MLCHTMVRHDGDQNIGRKSPHTLLEVVAWSPMGTASHSVDYVRPDGAASQGV